ncbi:carbohydrate porin [Parendozoicomonas haliclonae]|nr:carbohydrate porin [Parendozoicomonas haliclonae]
MHVDTIRASIIAALCFTPSCLLAAWTSPDGSLTIGGNAELNFDVIHDDRGVHICAKDGGCKDGAAKGDPTTGKLTKAQLNDDSRILLQVEWNLTRDDGAFVSAQAEPLIRTDNQVLVDEAYLMFGYKKEWYFQLGRYEAMNLFPLGKDIAMFYAAGSDGIGEGIYYYMAKEARGRLDKAGQARIVGEMGQWTAEVSTIYGNTADILKSSTIYRNDAEPNVSSDNNSFMVRPAINYQSENNGWGVSFGGEYEVNKDSVTYAGPTDVAQKYDLAHRYGLAATTTINTGQLEWNTSVAWQNAKESWKAWTVNSNIIYAGAAAIGASYAKNNFKHDATTYKTEDAKSYLIYTSYTVPILGFENTAVTFALSYSDTKNAYGKKGVDEKTTAFRTRFNYYF